MGWVAYSFIMFFGSVALYLFVRKAALQNISTSLSNLAMFGVPLCLFAADATTSDASLSLSTWQLFVIFISATVFAYGGAIKHQWVTLSFIAFFAWGFLSLSAKYLFDNAVSTQAFLLYLYTVVTLCIVVFDKIRIKDFSQLTASKWLSLGAIGIFSAVFNYGHFQAIRLAPNVGYINAFNAASIALVTIMAVIFFGDDLTSRKAIGVAGITAGLLLLLV